MLFQENVQGADIFLDDLYACDASGKPQGYFPKGTTAYFNLTVTNTVNDSINISIYLTIQDILDVPIGSDELNAVAYPNASTCYIMSVFIPKWAFVGVATAFASVFIEGTPVDTKTTEFVIDSVDLTPPIISLLSPQNSTYEAVSVDLVFTVDERTSWMGYSLDNHDKVSITGNTTLTDLTNCMYSIIVYANDTSGNIGSSEEVYFTIVIVHDVAVVDLECSSMEVFVGQTINITIFVKNKGTINETFDVITYANAAAIETRTVNNLSSRKQTTIFFIWNTTNTMPSNYTLSAQAIAVDGEMNITDNIYIDSIVNIKPRPDIAVTYITPAENVIGQGYSVSINVTIENQGNYLENFNVTTYANAKIIQTKTVILASGDSINITFIWSTISFDKSSYTISAYAWPIFGETDIVDNMFMYEAIRIVIPGDINADGTVDVFDGVLLSHAVGSHPSDTHWNPNSDINNDSRVDIFDTVILANNVGKTDP